MDIIDRIIDWNVEKFGENGAKKIPAFEKYLEEHEELNEAVKSPHVKEESVDVLITIVGHLFAVCNDRQEVIEQIENKLETIENREGKVVDGKFVKEEDIE